MTSFEYFIALVTHLFGCKCWNSWFWKKKLGLSSIMSLLAILYSGTFLSCLTKPKKGRVFGSSWITCWEVKCTSSVTSQSLFSFLLYCITEKSEFSFVPGGGWAIKARIVSVVPLFHCRNNTFCERSPDLFPIKLAWNELEVPNEHPETELCACWKDAGRIRVSSNVWK